MNYALQTIRDYSDSEEGNKAFDSLSVAYLSFHDNYVNQNKNKIIIRKSGQNVWKNAQANFWRSLFHCDPCFSQIYNDLFGIKSGRKVMEIIMKKVPQDIIDEAVLYFSPILTSEI